MFIFVTTDLAHRHVCKLYSFSSGFFYFFLVSICGHRHANNYLLILFAYFRFVVFTVFFLFTLRFFFCSFLFFFIFLKVLKVSFYHGTAERHPLNQAVVTL